MATRGQSAGYLIRKPSGFVIFGRSRERSSIWNKDQDNNVGSACGFPNLSLPPNPCSPHLLHPPLSSCFCPLFSPFPIRPLLRPRSLDFSSLFSAMSAPDSSNPTAHGNEARRPQSSPNKTVRVVIKGSVQGVFYRNWTIDNAMELNLKGWVRNRRDGSVEALFSGDPESVDGMLEKCRRGPPAAMVTGLYVSPSTDDPGTGFERRPTS